MIPAIHEVPFTPPEAWARAVADQPGLVLLRSHGQNDPRARYSYLSAKPSQVFRARGFYSELEVENQVAEFYGNPWAILERLWAPFESLNTRDLPFPAGGCFGYWGYDLKNALEPRLPRQAVQDLPLWDCWAGFYPSLVVFDHALQRSWIVATGFDAGGQRYRTLADEQMAFWSGLQPSQPPTDGCRQARNRRFPVDDHGFRHEHSPFFETETDGEPVDMASGLSREQFVSRVKKAQDYITAGDVYQVNLSQRWDAPLKGAPWDFYHVLSRVSPAPYSAFIDTGDSALLSSSPELFLKMSGRHVVTRPIKGTRPRGHNAIEDAALAGELKASAKENAELVMITDLLRNDLGRVCEYGSIRVPDLARLESFPQVHHLVSTVEGDLRPEVGHLKALADCFPGGSITGAPKIRAMEIIDELEPTARGPYTGSIGYLGFNGESQWNILIRTAVCHEQRIYFQTGAGIVADSVPEAEYEETLHKAKGFFQALAEVHTATGQVSLRR